MSHTVSIRTQVRDPIAVASEARFYDGKGSYAGRATTSGNTTRFYDGQGKYVGSKTK